MVALQLILDLLNARKNRALRIAESSMLPPQFKAFRRLFLDEFGKSGLERDLVSVFAEEQGKERHG